METERARKRGKVRVNIYICIRMYNDRNQALVKEGIFEFLIMAADLE